MAGKSVGIFVGGYLKAHWMAVMLDYQQAVWKEVLRAALGDDRMVVRWVECSVDSMVAEMVASKAAYSGVQSVDSMEKRMVEKTETLSAVESASRRVDLWVLKVWKTAGKTAGMLASLSAAESVATKEILLVVESASRTVGRWVLKVWRSVGLTAGITAGKSAFLTVLS